MNRKKRILIAPLNWGLGHASRCIPIIERFRVRGADVVLAADGRPYDFLKNEFPDAELHRLRDINITYPDSSSMLGAMLRQLPQLLSTYRNERAVSARLIADLKIDGIVSDNRFGLFSGGIPCIYMTHQISIMPPRLFAWSEPVLRRVHAALISRYTECWIPDSPGEINLSGALSHGIPLPSNAQFIGPLSRLHPADVPIRYDCAVVLSGPEPQRTIFESIILRQIEKLPVRAIVIQGIPGVNASS
ncbi:MAG TPA: glycosyltransferase, partial [Bacteroidota bacterium]|nr:glycosyltransferase [Bacteroidota bacterium]